MSEERKRVKELAGELGLATKDILAAAKELNVLSAKAATSSLSETDVSRLRAHFAPAPGPEKQEVIVRRRRKDVVAEPIAEITMDRAADTAVAAVPPVSSEPSAPSAGGDIAAVPATPPAEASVEPVATPAPTPGSLPAPATHEAGAPAEKGRAGKKADAAEATSPAGPPTGKKAGKMPSARIIKKAGEADLPEISPAPESPAAAALPPAETVEESIAAPAQVEKAAESGVPAAKAEAKTEVKAEESPKKARVIRPAAFSAEPERNAEGEAVSSAPALPPKSEHAGHADDEGGRPVSQVRVISRPDPGRQNAGDQGGYRGRSDGSRPPRPAAGAAPRPGGGYRPSGAPAGQGGPGRPGVGAMPGGPGAPGGEGEQGRKKRQKGRRTVDFSDMRERSGDEDAGWSKSSRRGKGRKSRDVAPMGGTQPVKAVKRKIKVDEFIRVSDLAHQMQLKSGEIIKVLFNLGIMATINQSLDIDTATVVASEFGYEIEKTGFDEQELIVSGQEESKPEDMVGRPPVVTIMGHVDHGKTSLLDAIRKSSVVSGEAGGITQHIGAYHVTTKKGEIVFLDTPGHEAFTAMRARGAKVTDIVVLVVAADDGVMEQTREAVNHARAAEVPIMVAVNKMDKPSANPDRVKRELADQGLVPEEWGGDTTFSYVSAKTRDGLDELLELLALQAEILELKANPKIAARGHIIEAKLDKGRGALGTVLIQEGTLHPGDNFVCGVHSGRVRAMFNDQGKKVKEAGPAMPVEVQGFEGVPEAGEEFICIADDKAARRIAEARALKQRERELAKESKITLETFLARRADNVEAEVLNLVVKADVQGSLEAITDALRKLSTEKVRIQVIHGGTGAVSESDVLLATASNAVIIGFNVRPSVKAKELAEHEKVDIRFYDIIYKLVEEIKSAMEGMLAPIAREEFLGTADVRETFSVPKVGVIAGCHVSDGKILRNAQIRLLRDGVVVHTGKIGSLRRFKDDVREVAKGYECGIGLENYNDIKIGDAIEAFEIIEEAAKL